MEILIAILILGVLGLLFGIGLAVASKKFCVKVDPRLEKIYALMPGANCGACGKAGCMGLVEAMITGEAMPDKCALLKPEQREAVAKILGVTVSEKVKKTAVLFCQGGKKVKDRFHYTGIPSCQAATLVLGGQKYCSYGCLGFGDCIKVCPFDALRMGHNQLPIVDINKCRACSKCVKTCPRHLFTLVDQDKKVHIACRSHDLGKDVIKICPVGCIACKKCVNTCPVKAINVSDNLAMIDYTKCIVCGKCVDVCPTKAIMKLK